MDVRGVKVVLGLGNPGAAYAGTYHNVGLMAVDRLAEARGRLPRWRKRPLYEWTKVGRLTLIRPRTFMNDAGRAAKTAVRDFGVKPHELLVVHDDSDIAIGAHRLSFGRGAAGHRGVLSVLRLLRTSELFRFRIGIRPRSGDNAAAVGGTSTAASSPRARAQGGLNVSNRAKAGAFVLKTISPDHAQALHSSFEALQEKLTVNETEPSGSSRTLV